MQQLKYKNICEIRSMGRRKESDIQEMYQARCKPSPLWGGLYLPFNGAYTNTLTHTYTHTILTLAISEGIITTLNGVHFHESLISYFALWKPGRRPEPYTQKTFI